MLDKRLLALELSTCTMLFNTARSLWGRVSPCELPANPGVSPGDPPDPFAELLALVTGGRRWATPLDLACELDPRIVRTPALELINSALVQAFDTPDARLAISMPPQEGKTTLVVQYFIRGA